MNIAFDWDGTCTGDIPTFFKVAEILKEAGHQIYIVTMRYPSEITDIPLAWYELMDGVHCTCREAKDKHMKAQGINIHIWIEDTPRAVHENCEQIWGWRSPEGHIVIPDHDKNSVHLREIPAAD